MKNTLWVVGWRWLPKQEVKRIKLNTSHTRFDALTDDPRRGLVWEDRRGFICVKVYRNGRTAALERQFLAAYGRGRNFAFFSVRPIRKPSDFIANDSERWCPYCAKAVSFKEREIMYRDSTVGLPRLRCPRCTVSVDDGFVKANNS